jgi:hypothetical protein
MYQAFTLFVKITAQLSLLRNDFTTGARGEGGRREKPEIRKKMRGRGREREREG